MGTECEKLWIAKKLENVGGQAELNINAKNTKNILSHLLNT
jgi:hypothetical protein